VREREAKRDFEGAFNLAEEEASRLRSGAARLAQEVEEAERRQEEAEAAKGRAEAQLDDALDAAEAMQTKLASSEALLSDAKQRLWETAGADMR